MGRSDAPHLRISALFIEPGRPTVLEPEAKPRIIFAIPKGPRPDIAIWSKSDTIASIRFPAAQNSNDGFANPAKLNVSVFLHRRLRRNFCSNSAQRRWRTALS
jgi:hypothetical protein